LTPPGALPPAFTGPRRQLLPCRAADHGTGIYQGATGRVLSSKEDGDNASDVVVRIHLH
jgi:hypothetical protein